MSIVDRTFRKSRGRTELGHTVGIRRVEYIPSAIQDFCLNQCAHPDHPCNDMCYEFRVFQDEYFKQHPVNQKGQVNQEQVENKAPNPLRCASSLLFNQSNGGCK